MKYIPLLTICTLTFLLAPVEGTAVTALLFLFYLSNRLSELLFNEQRDKRDCDAAFAEIQIVPNEKCVCFGLGSDGVIIECSSIDENICLSPSDARFCTNTSAATSDYRYNAYTASRSALGFFSSPLVTLESVGVTIETGGFQGRFSFSFFRDGGSSEYSGCSIYATSNRKNELPGSGIMNCIGCDICESGVDFKYDCSNTYIAFEYIYGPKVESCIPVADVIPNL